MEVAGAGLDQLKRDAIGRFAPSPTGPLHFGSLVAALGSYLNVKANAGQWLVRIEDIDPPREAPQAAAQILHALEAFGLHPDAPILRQSSRIDAYRAVLQELIQSGNAFPCFCTRSQLAGMPHRGRCGPVLPEHPVSRWPVLRGIRPIHHDITGQGHRFARSGGTTG